MTDIRARSLPPCFYCGNGWIVHANNGMAHPWRRGDRVTEEDLRMADEKTADAYRQAWQIPLI
jgi:hypothetical protein